MSRPRNGIPPIPDHMKIAEHQDTEPVPLTGVLIKMGLFTIAMVVLPIGSYYLSRDYYFGSNLAGAGMTAASVANIILIAFVVMAIREDSGNQPEQTGKAGTTKAVAPKESKKSQ